MAKSISYTPILFLFSHFVETKIAKYFRGQSVISMVVAKSYYLVISVLGYVPAVDIRAYT